MKQQKHFIDKECYYDFVITDKQYKNWRGQEQYLDSSNY